MSGLQLAISSDFTENSHQMESLEDMMKKIAAAGFTHLHWCHEWDGDYVYSSYEMAQIREWMNAYHLTAKALHASKGSARNPNLLQGHYRRDYTSDMEYNRKAGVELIMNRVELASVIGASEIVLHLYVPHLTIGKDKKRMNEFYDTVCRSLDELQPYCREKGVRICLENLFDMPADIEFDQFDRLFAKYPPEFLGFCFDAGHAFMVWGDQMTDVIYKYKDRLFAVHLHDNFGAVDFHLLPGKGGIDWPAVMKALAETAYELPLILEVMCSLDVNAFLTEAHEMGEWLNGLYLSAKESL